MIGPDLLAGMSYTPEELGASVNGEGSPTEASVETTQANGHGKQGKPFSRFLRRCAELEQELGRDRYRAVLRNFELDHAGQVEQSDTDTMTAIVRSLESDPVDGPPAGTKSEPEVLVA